MRNRNGVLLYMRKFICVASIQIATTHCEFLLHWSRSTPTSVIQRCVFCLQKSVFNQQSLTNYHTKCSILAYPRYMFHFQTKFISLHFEFHFMDNKKPWSCFIENCMHECFLGMIFLFFKLKFDSYSKGFVYIWYGHNNLVWIEVESLKVLSFITWNASYDSHSFC